MLRLLHPFMPFITEEIWSYLPKSEAGEENKDNLLIKEVWPKYDESLIYDYEVSVLNTAMEIIKAVRNIRAEVDAVPSKN